MSWTSSFNPEYENGGYEPPRPIPSSSVLSTVCNNNIQDAEDNQINSNCDHENYIPNSPYFKDDGPERVSVFSLSLSLNQFLSVSDPFSGYISCRYITPLILVKLLAYFL